MNDQPPPPPGVSTPPPGEASKQSARPAVEAPIPALQHGSAPTRRRKKLFVIRIALGALLVSVLAWLAIGQLDRKSSVDDPALPYSYDYPSGYELSENTEPAGHRTWVHDPSNSIDVRARPANPSLAADITNPATRAVIDGEARGWGGGNGEMIPQTIEVDGNPALSYEVVSGDTTDSAKRSVRFIAGGFYFVINCASAGGVESMRKGCDMVLSSFKVRKPKA